MSFAKAACLGISAMTAHRAVCAGGSVAGKLRYNVGATYALDKIARAHEEVECGSAMGGIVLTIDDSRQRCAYSAA